MEKGREILESAERGLRECFESRGEGDAAPAELVVVEFGAEAGQDINPAKAKSELQVGSMNQNAGVRMSLV